MLTRVDGDGRGGAALSMRAVTGLPISFLGSGEKLDGLDVFDARRVAGRILGQGDIVALVEKAKAEIDQAEAESMAKKMAKGQFDLDDLADQLRQMQRMGGLGGLMGMLPGVQKAKAADGRRQHQRQDAQAPGSDHPVDDAAASAASPTSSPPRASAASPPAPASTSPRSTRC